MLYLPFDNDYEDRSVNNNDGVISDPANVSFVSGKVGNALKFNGTEKRATVTVPKSASLMFEDQMTVSYWVRLDNYTGMNGNGTTVLQGIHAVFSKDRDTNGLMYNYIATDTKTNRFGVDNKFSSNTGDYSLGNWVHIAYVVSGNSITAYMNGNQVDYRSAETAINFASSNNAPLYIGRFQHNDYYPLNGALDDFRMYNRALTSAEIQSLYRLGE